MRHAIRALVGIAVDRRQHGTDWPSYGGGPTQTRYSPLTQINTENVASLKVAWTYDTRRRVQGLRNAMPARRRARRDVRGVAEAARVRARRGERRAEVELRPLRRRDHAEPDPAARADVLGARRRSAHLLRGAALALRAGRDHRKARFPRSASRAASTCARASRAATRGRSASGMNTPGVFYGDLLILGSLVPEGLPSAPGDIRAFNVFTGKQVWAFHTIPHPGELGYDTWPKDAWKYSGGANAWSGVSLDEARGLVFASTGSASYDFYGANRLGDDLFANTILCLKRGNRRARLALPGDQARSLGPRFPRAARARHDREGRPAPRRRRADRRRTANLYVLDRETGQPIYPMREVTPPASDVPGERSAPTQLLPDAAAAVHAPAVHRGPDHEAHAGGREGRARRCGRRSASAASTTRRARRARSSFRAWTAAASGAASPSTRPRACSTSTRTRWRGA